MMNQDKRMLTDACITPESWGYSTRDTHTARVRVHFIQVEQVSNV
jgi:hypothetical protein